MSNPFAATTDPARPEALQVLLDASAMLLASSSESEVLSGILDLASKLIQADAYAVWRAFDADTIWRAVAHRGFSESYRTEITTTTLINRPIRLQVYEDITSDVLLRAHHEAYRAEGIRSMLVAPLILQGANAGTITFYWRNPRVFSRADRDNAAALANLSAAALNISELYEANAREKRRLSFLAEASALLASSLDYETTLQQVARLAVPHVADWCTVHIVENGAVNRLIVAHADPAQLALAEEFSKRYPEEIRPDFGLGLLLRTGATEVFPRITEEMLIRGTRSAEHLADVRRLGLTSSILVALTSRGKILGAIRLIAARPGKYFTADDVQLAEDLARRAAAAIENAQLHRAVLQQESQLRLSHAAARMGSWNWDLASQQIVWSAEFKSLHGLTPDADAGYDGGASLVHPEDRDRVLTELTAVLASDSEQINTEHRAVTPDGRVLWIHSRGRIERDAHGTATGIMGISIDVTESRLAEEALRRTEKLAAAGRLAATVAHEVNNPLEALTNLVYLARNTDGLPAEAAAFLKTAESEISRISHIVQQTLGFYRESVHPRPTDIGIVVAEVLELYRSRATSRSIRLSHTADHATIAKVNGGEIKQVVANLISNALDATPPDGTVHTSVTRAEDSVIIRVVDSGTGIAPEHLSKLFEPFFTTKSDVGTGLGLWVSKGIVEKHGGTLTVVSQKEPSGTTMTITMPLAQTVPTAE